MSKKPTKDPEYISAYQYAERKKVSSTAVYDKIKSGEITVTMLGKRKFIDWGKFLNIEFPRSDRFTKDVTPQII